MHGRREHVAVKNKTKCEPKPGFLLRRHLLGKTRHVFNNFKVDIINNLNIGESLYAENLRRLMMMREGIVQCSIGDDTLGT